MTREIDRIRPEIRALEARRPSPDENPAAFKAINDEITRKIDRAREYDSWSKKVPA